MQDTCDEGPEMDGWAGIEDHLMKHDSRVLKDHAEDIDTLLVFVSSILDNFTALVISNIVFRPRFFLRYSRLLSLGLTLYFKSTTPMLRTACSPIKFLFKLPVLIYRGSSTQLYPLFYHRNPTHQPTLHAG